MRAFSKSKIFVIGFQTGGDNSNKRCLSNTACNLSPPGKLKDLPDFFGDITAKMPNVPKMSRKYVIFPGKIPESPDSRQNLQIPGKICFSPETGLVRVVIPRISMLSKWRPRP